MACIFCSIVAREAPAFFVYEEDDVVAFLDRGQVTEGHTLVVPTRHATDIWALAESEASRVMAVAWRVAHMLRDSLMPLGLNVMQSNGEAAWQDVFHFHLHLIPRYANDALVPPWRATTPTAQELDSVRAKILERVPDV